MAYGAAAFGFWAKAAPKYLGDERIRSSAPLVIGKRLVVGYQPLGLVGVIGPWNYPLTNSFGDCIPAMAAGNSVLLEARDCDPTDFGTARRGSGGVRGAGGCLPMHHRPRRDCRRRAR